jgi:hypothetical protein
MPVTNSGSEIFMEIPGINGKFSTSAPNSNTGSATIDGGSVTSSYNGHNYQISFTTAGTYAGGSAPSPVVSRVAPEPKRLFT